MAVGVQVSGTGTNQALIGNLIFETSTSVYAVIVGGTTADTVEVYKGTTGGLNPTAFTRQDTANEVGNADNGRWGAAMGSDGIIHIMMYREVSMSDHSVRHTTFHTDDATSNQDTYQIIDSEIMTIPSFTPFAFTRADVCVDSNNVPHAIALEEQKDMGSDRYTVWYNNKIGGSWNGTNIEIDGITNGNSLNYQWAWDCFNPSSSAPNIEVPCLVSYENTTDSYSLYYGNALDATSFTKTVIDTNPPGIISLQSVSVKSNGDVWVIDTTSSTNLATYEHAFADSLVEGNWTQRNVTTTSTIDDARLFISDGDVPYVVLCEGASSPAVDIYQYWKFESGSWSKVADWLSFDGFLGDNGISNSQINGTRPTRLHMVHREGDGNYYNQVDLSGGIVRKEYIQGYIPQVIM